MRAIRAIGLFGISISFFFCAGKESEYPVVIQIIDGVKVVANPGYPRDGEIEYEFEEDLSIGGDVVDEDYIFHHPQDVKVGEDGTVFVMDWGNSTLKLYGPDGRYLRTLGGRGQGPGEFERFINFSLGSNGKIFVMDSVRHRIAILNQEGDYTGGFRIEDGFLTDVAVDEDNSVFVGVKLRDKDYEWLNIRRYDELGRRQADYGEFKLVQPVIERVKTDSGISTRSMKSRHAATTVWTVSPDGSLYAGYGDTYEVCVFDREGHLLLKFGRDHTPVANTYAGRTGQSDSVGIFNVLNRHWCFDGVGNIWIPVFVSDDAEDFLYDVFSPEGIYLNQVTVPHRILQFKSGKIFCLVRDEYDYVSVKRFYLILKDNQSAT